MQRLGVCAQAPWLPSCLSSASLVFVKEYVRVGFLNLQTKGFVNPLPSQAHTPSLPSTSFSSYPTRLPGEVLHISDSSCLVSSPSLGAQAVDIHKAPDHSSSVRCSGKQRK